MTERQLCREFEDYWRRKHPLKLTKVEGRPWDSEGSDGHFYWDDGTVSANWSNEDQERADAWRVCLAYYKEHGYVL